MHIRAAIVDDEPLGRLRIRGLLEEEPDIEVVGEYPDAQKAARGIAETRPNLLFLDVQIPGGSAFTVLDGLETGDDTPATIFITGHREYALKAFEFDAAGYLLKPFDMEQFHQSLARARRLIATPKETLSRLAVKRDGKVYLFRLDAIDWMETAGNGVRLHAGQECYEHRESLPQLEARLDRRRFVRINHSTVVNIDRVVMLQPSFDQEHVVVLSDHTRLQLTAPHRARVQALTGAF
jgi:two-component system LytT family response regulator